MTKKYNSSAKPGKKARGVPGSMSLSKHYVSAGGGTIHPSVKMSMERIANAQLTASTASKPKVEMFNSLDELMGATKKRRGK